MNRKPTVDNMLHWENLELNKELAKQLNQYSAPLVEQKTEVINDVVYSISTDGSHEACHPNYIHDWDILTPLSLKFCVFLSPLAWERSPQKYRAKLITINKDGERKYHGMRYMSDDDDPSRCLVMTLIKVLKNFHPNHSLLESTGLLAAF
ncbi:hypothetical protein [Photobacterium kishitanii]|uniref:Uncharacterized protein n=1 Tax=Photobacterium kishitanii TaxID=318456 RepID=A0A2T3KLP3_9GAMM|nr:hypothetical protein [Photobacterium kishitanii]PSV00644.1 hypothetical protein C9J27_05765 [Photobacterium kishitanii]